MTFLCFILMLYDFTLQGMSLQTYDHAAVRLAIEIFSGNYPDNLQVRGLSYINTNLCYVCGCVLCVCIHIYERIHIYESDSMQESTMSCIHAKL